MTGAPNIWVTADRHFGHANMIKYVNRPFESRERMDEALVEAWNSRVRPGDTVWHLGDLVYCRGATPVSAYLDRLNGNISFVPGNHDRRQTLDAFAERPRHTVCPPIWEVGSEAKSGLKIVLCHYAMRTWPGSHHGSLHLYAHSHGRLEPLGHKRQQVANRVARFLVR